MQAGLNSNMSWPKNNTVATCLLVQFLNSRWWVHFITAAHENCDFFFLISLHCKQAKPLLSSGEIKQLVDPFLGNDYDCDEMERMTLAASLCTRTSSHSRPDMSLVRTWFSTWKEEHLQFHQKQHRSLRKPHFNMLIMRPRSWNCSKGTTKQSLGHGRRSPPASTVRMRRSQPLSRTCSRIWALRCSGWRRTTRSRAAAAPWTPRPTATGAGRRASTSTLNLQSCVYRFHVFGGDWRDDCVRAVENRGLPAY